jgi:hypothetical protein
MAGKMTVEILRERYGLSNGSLILDMVESGFLSKPYASDLLEGNGGDVQATEFVLRGAAEIAGRDEGGLQRRILPQHIFQFLCDLYDG